MEFLDNFKNIAPFLQHPLVLVGFVILLFFGILTGLFKAGILPPLPKRTAGDIVKRVINFGFIIAVLVIFLGFWEHLHEDGTNDSSDGAGSTHNATNPEKHDTSANLHLAGGDMHSGGAKVYCKIMLLLPSDLNDAEILVDGKLADIVERKLTSITIRMEKREISQKITLRNSFRECTTRVLVDGDKQLQPCL